MLISIDRLKQTEIENLNMGSDKNQNVTSSSHCWVREFMGVLNYKKTYGIFASKFESCWLRSFSPISIDRNTDRQIENHQNETDKNQKVRKQSWPSG